MDSCLLADVYSAPTLGDHVGDVVTGAVIYENVAFCRLLIFHCHGFRLRDRVGIADQHLNAISVRKAHESVFALLLLWHSQPISVWSITQESTNPGINRSVFSVGSPAIDLLMLCGTSNHGP